MRVSNTGAVAVFCSLVLFSTGVGAQSGAQPPRREPFVFRQGQAVYVTAFHAIEHSTRRSHATRVSGGIDNHLPAELQVRKDFEKRGVYRLVNKASEADFVFLVLLDDWQARSWP